MSESGSNEPRNIVRVARHEIVGRTSALVARGLADLDRLSTIAASRLSTEIRDIHEAAYKGDVATVRAILSASPNQINARDKYKRTPIHSAAMGGQVGVVELLLDYGADINARGDNGHTPLHFYRIMSLYFDFPNADVVEVLLAHGADPNALTNHGSTPLHHFAISEDKTECVKLLLQYGANVNAKRSGYGDETAIEIAAYRGNRNTGDVLLANGAMLDIHVAAGLGMCDTVREYLHADGRLVLSSKRGLTPLHWAAHSGQLDVARLLMSCGADVEAVGTRKQTPLHEAVEGGSEQIADFLIKVGANVNSKGEYGKTALDFAEALNFRFTKRYCPNLLSILHKHGARSGKR
jgi:cytohesin